jgi:hypothetical protein
MRMVDEYPYIEQSGDASCQSIAAISGPCASVSSVGWVRVAGLSRRNRMSLTHSSSS